MPTNIAEAISAYRNMQRESGLGGLSARDAAPGDSFAEALREATDDAIATLKTSEEESMKAAMGKADLNELVVAVSKAELTLQTVVTLRDRAIQAYQDIMRMPI